MVETRRAAKRLSELAASQEPILREAKIALKRPISDSPRKMSDQFFYVHFTFTPRKGAHDHRREAVVEVPRDLVQREQSQATNEHSREKAIALDLARRVALDTFESGTDRIAWPDDEDAVWYEDRPLIINKRPCDHEENGTRAWRIV
jgi:hypothetical protein